MMTMIVLLINNYKDYVRWGIELTMRMIMMAKITKSKMITTMRTKAAMKILTTMMMKSHVRPKENVINNRG